MSLTTFYDVLRVAEDATPQEISKAYHILASSLHADKLQDMPEEVRCMCESRMQEIGEAYDTLKRADLRKKYDHLLAQVRAEESARQQAQQASANPPKPAQQTSANPPNSAQQPSAGGHYASQSAAQQGPAYTAPNSVPPAQQQPPAQVYKPDYYRVLWPRVRAILGIVLVALFLVVGLSLKTIVAHFPVLKELIEPSESVTRTVPRHHERPRRYSRYRENRRR